VSLTGTEIVERIWARDPALWTGHDEAKWLGWLDEPWRMREDVELLSTFADLVVDRIDAVVLLGMGGSSLAPEVVRRTFRQETFHVLDTTHPQAIRDLEQRLDLARTLFISASKSGSTLETRSHTEYFWKQSPRGENFAAITDPGSALEQLALERDFGAVFAGEPTIGGRYSAPSPFGLGPGALVLREGLGPDVPAAPDTPDFVLALFSAEPRACQERADFLETIKGLEEGRRVLYLQRRGAALPVDFPTALRYHSAVELFVRLFFGFGGSVPEQERSLEARTYDPDHHPGHRD